MSNMEREIDTLEQQAADMTARIEQEREAFTDALMIAHSIGVSGVAVTPAVQRCADREDVSRTIVAAFERSDALERLFYGFMAEAAIVSPGDGVNADLGEVRAEAVILNPYVLAEVLRHVWNVAYCAGAREAIFDPTAKPLAAMAAVQAKRQAIESGRNAEAVVIEETTDGASDSFTTPAVH